MRIVIIGVGAMGCLYGSRLAPFAQVKLLGTWQQGVDAIRERGIIVDTADTTQVVRVFATTDARKIGECDLAIIARKAWQTQVASAQAALILAPHGLVLSMQNGLGNIEQIADIIGAQRAVLGVTTQGSSLIEAGRIRYAGSGPTHIGVTPETRVRLLNVVTLFEQAGFETHLTDNVQGLLWGKLAVNCGINALSALLRVPNGELLARDDAEEVMIRASRECAAVARAKGIVLPYTDPANSAREVARATATNRSSMLQDILRDAPTEIEAINGAVTREGARLSVPTPTNEMLWRLVRALKAN